MRGFKEVILRFARILREWNFDVSTDQVADALRIISKIGVESPELLRNVLKTTMLTARDKKDLFDHLFDTYFYQGKIESFKETVGEDPFIHFLLTGDISHINEQIEQVLNQVFDAGFNIKTFNAFLWRVYTASGLSDAREKLENYLQDLLEEGSITKEEYEELMEKGLENIKKLKDKFSQMLEMKMIDKGYSRRERVENLVEREFYTLNEEELKELRHLSKDLGRALRIILSLRRKRAQKGILDVRRTIRNSLETEGIPFKLYQKERKIKKPKLLIFADVSSSMRHSVEFFMRLVFAIRSEFSSVKIFAFVAECTEITEHIKNVDISDFLDRLFGGEYLDIYSYTSYGSSLRHFMETSSQYLTRKTTAIFIGDGRSNYTDPGEEVIKEMSERVKSIYWLNPEPVYAWFTGDSEMKTFIPYTNGAFVIRSLKNIWDFILNLYGTTTSATPFKITGTPSWFTVR